MLRLKQNKTAFTLVELLVVISIIALLLSILMPSLTKARGLAKTVVCASNQKQISLAFHMYMDGSARGVFPPKWNSGTPVQYPFQVTLYKDVGKNDKVFRCPTSPDPQHGKWNDKAKTPYYLSYGYNPGIGNVKQLAIKQPSKVIVIADTMMSYSKKCQDLNLWGPYWSPAFGQSIIADWHDKRGNILFADFSVGKHDSKEQYLAGYLYAGWWPLGR